MKRSVYKEGYGPPEKPTRSKLLMGVEVLEILKIGTRDLRRLRNQVPCPIKFTNPTGSRKGIRYYEDSIYNFMENKSNKDFYIKNNQNG